MPICDLATKLEAGNLKTLKCDEYSRFLKDLRNLNTTAVYNNIYVYKHMEYRRFSSILFSDIVKSCVEVKEKSLFIDECNEHSNHGDVASDDSDSSGSSQARSGKIQMAFQLPNIKPYADFSFIPNKARELVGAIHLCLVCKAIRRSQVVGPHGRQQQFDTPSSLISAHQWPHRPCSGLSWFYRVGKRLPVKADLAIYSLIVGMSGQWVNVVTMLNNKLDFYCCDNSVGFCKSSHICFKLSQVTHAIN